MAGTFGRGGRGTVVLLTILALQAAAPARAAGGMQLVEVTGVAADDMLKMRAGPGTGYKVIVGLPNGTQVYTHGCDRVGGTPWCKITLKAARGLKGYVSGHYLTGN